MTSTTTSPSSSDRFPGKFREHLSIFVPPFDHPVSSSRFSPESPPNRPRTQHSWANSTSKSSSTTMPPRERDVEAHPGTTSPASSPRSFRDRFTKFFFNIRTRPRNRDSEMVPIQTPQLPPWPPLQVEKKTCCHDCPCHKQKKNRSCRDKVLIVVLIIIILYLLGNVLFLNIRVLNPPALPTPTNTTRSNSASLSPDAQQCLSQYNLNAPANPSAYPCSSCLSVLQAVPSNFSDGNAQDSQQIQNAIQFCALRSIFESSNSDGQTDLKNGDWVNDVRFCAWSGVSCDGAGRVASLTLTFPGVPSSIPNEFGALTGLQTLHVIGNSAIPAGSLPGSFTSLGSLTLLHLESTSITALPDNLFSSLSKLTTLELVKNAQMGNSLPSSLEDLRLQNLVVNGQSLTNPLSALASSSSLQSSLQLLDLSSTTISGVIPSSISSFSSLVELHLDSNNLSTPLPPNFPPTLQSLSLSNNTGLAGPVSGSFCTLGKLQNCNMSGTGLTAAGGCGVCMFSSTS